MSDSILHSLQNQLSECLPADKVQLQRRLQGIQRLPADKKNAVLAIIKQELEKAIENYASLGLRVAITELDVTATGNNSGAFDVNTGRRDIPAENYIKQAEVYEKLFEIFMRHSDVIDRVTLWGVSDTRSWRRGQDALLFDGELQPKPAFHAVIEAGKRK